MNQKDYKAIAKALNNIKSEPFDFCCKELADYFEKEAEGIFLCRHCEKEIYLNGQECDLDYDYRDGEIIAHDVLRKIYNHCHNDEHLCDSGKTGAHPKDRVFDKQQFLKNCGVK